MSGYFDSRQAVWSEPIYRNVWGLLTEFGDAELASMVAPRSLLIEACKGPQVSVGGGGGAPGQLVSPTLEVVKAEHARAEQLVAVAEAESCGVSAVQATRENKLPYFGTVGARRVPNRADLYEITQVIENFLCYCIYHFIRHLYRGHESGFDTEGRDIGIIFCAGVKFRHLCDGFGIIRIFFQQFYQKKIFGKISRIS